MVVLGYRRSSFKGDNGETVEGINLYLSYPIDADKGDGQACDRFFLTRKRLQEIGYNPSVGDEVRPEYNRYGKICGLELI